MISITQHICYLLLSHDFVVVPGLGAFVASHNAATFNSATATFTPPARTLAFNRDVRHDDGILTTCVARNRAITYDLARTQIANDVALIRSRLSSDGAVTLPAIGTLTLSADNAIIFTPAEKCVAGARYFGLENITVAEAVIEEPAIIHVDFKTPRRLRWARIAAAAALLIGIGYTVSTPIAVDLTNTHFAAIGSAKVTPAHAAEIPAIDTAAAPRTLYSIIPTDPDATGQYIPKATVAEEPRLAANDSKTLKEIISTTTQRRANTYYLVVASCESRAKAERYVKRRQAQGLRIVEGNGRYRVYTASASSQESAERMRSSIASVYPDVWILSPDVK